VVGNHYVTGSSLGCPSYTRNRDALHMWHNS
jgi:hypothetical protein